MFLADPPPSQADLHFRLFDVPVRIHPFFWVVALFLGMRGGSTPPQEVFIWVGAVLVSLLVHEFGHAVTQRRYGGRPRIVLYALGGLAICDDCDRSSRSQILISLAGPVAGFLFAGALTLILLLTGHHVGVLLPGGLQLLTGSLEDATGIPFLGIVLIWERLASVGMNNLILDLFWINIMWGVINLLPIYPLDGGRISRELCMLGQPQSGMVLSLQISFFAAAGMAIVGLILWQSIFVTLFFGFMAYTNYKTMEAYRASLW